MRRLRAGVIFAVFVGVWLPKALRLALVNFRSVKIESSYLSYVYYSCTLSYFECGAYYFFLVL